MQYFATETVENIGKELLTRVRDYYEYVRQTGLLPMWRAVYYAYYAGLDNQGRVQRGGKAGETRRISINLFKGNLQRLKSIISSQRPAFVAKAANTDYKSMAQAIVANDVIEYYLREKQLEKIEHNALDLSLRYGEGWMLLEWDKTAGEAYAVDESGESSQVVMQGDVVSKAFGPLDIIRDVKARTVTEWKIVRQRCNKWDLAAKYPDYADDITRQQSNPSELYDSVLDPTRWDKGQGDNDTIAVYTFYHARTASVQDGRRTEFLDDGTVIYDGELPYSEVPLYEVYAENIDDDPFGYSLSFDLVQVSKVLSGLYSTVVSNITAAGTTKVMNPRGSGVRADQYSAEFPFIDYNPQGGVPTPLVLPQTQPEVYNFMGRIESTMANLAGLNYVTAGTSEQTKGMSGSALALMESMTIRFVNNLQQNFTLFRERYATGIINILKRYAETPRIIRVAGQSNRPYVREFKGADIADISRVSVEIGNPLTQTLSGRIDLADKLLQGGLVKSMNQYLTIIDTGRADQFYGAEQAEGMLIISENERLKDGTDCPVMVTDDHANHIREHRVIVASPEAREDPRIVAAFTRHELEHINFLKDAASMDLLTVLGQQPLPPPMPAAPTGGMPAPTGGEPTAGEPPSMPTMPEMPDNPSTGEQYTPSTGGL